MDCRDWDEEQYRESILREREALSCTVFRTTFVRNPNPNPNCDSIIVASSDGCIASYSITSCLKMGCGNSRRRDWLVAEPQFLIQGHDGPAYDVKFYDDSLLLSCGDDGRIKGWNWKDISGIEEPSNGIELKPALDLLNPQHKGPWGALSPIPENNGIAADPQNGSIYSATGDSNAYCWDVEKSVIKMVFKGHSNYVHCIVSCNLSSQIVTGSEDGTARIWDCKSGKCIQMIVPDKDMKSNLYFPRVSCVALDSSENWLVCGKGQSLSLWNLHARECLSSVKRNSPIQDVMFDGNQILSVGAEPLLTRSNINGDILSQIRCAPQTAFSVSLHPSGVTAVGGYGAMVDIISQFGSHLCTFRCRGL